jgi:hypothetical protein
MPFLQLDIPGHVDVLTRRRIAGLVGRCYADTMHVQRRVPAVAVRCNDGGPWRWEDGEMREVVVLMCDIRRGRTDEQREHAARTLATLIAHELHVDLLRVVVEFTQHDADEMFRYGRIAEHQPAPGGETGAPAT